VEGKLKQKAEYKGNRFGKSNSAGVTIQKGQDRTTCVFCSKGDRWRMGGGGAKGQNLFLVQGLLSATYGVIVERRGTFDAAGEKSGAKEN